MKESTFYFLTAFSLFFYVWSFFGGFVAAFSGNFTRFLIIVIGVLIVILFCASLRWFTDRVEITIKKKEVKKNGKRKKSRA